MSLTEGQRLLLRAYVHIAGGNGPVLDERGIYVPVRNPWTAAEQYLVAEICKAVYDEIAVDTPSA